MVLSKGPRKEPCSPSGPAIVPFLFERMKKSSNGVDFVFRVSVFTDTFEVLERQMCCCGKISLSCDLATRRGFKASSGIPWQLQTAMVIYTL